MMKWSLLLFGILACNSSQNDETLIKESQSEQKGTSSALTNLPAVFSGTVGCDNCDSVKLEFSLSTDLQYTLDKQFIGKKTGKPDSSHTEIGEWTLDNSNVIDLRSSEGSAEFSKFKLVDENVLQLLDSTGSVIADGKNYELYRENS